MSKTQLFIEKARAVHGDRYDYSKTVYVRSKDKVIIACKEHGDFEQMPSGHLTGRGCRECGKASIGASLTFTLGIFIEKARAKHGSRYDYSKVVYVCAHDKVTITCNEHGDFEQIPDSHLRGRGCPTCGVRKRAISQKTSSEKWIKSAILIHGHRYNYGQGVYINTDTKILIICGIHGGFYKTPNHHLRGQGCPECSRIEISERIISAKAKLFIASLQEVHGELYGYSKVTYNGSKRKIDISCKIHGYFRQFAGDHLSGYGCPKCGGYNKTSAEWVIEAKGVHGDRYDYSKVDYVHSKEKVIITCKEHGDFEQRVDHHARGSGCPKCAPSPFDRNQPTAIYLMQMGAQVKIGISIDPDTRLAQLNRNNPEPARIVTTWTLKDFPTAHTVEQQLHQRLRDYHAGLTGFDGATEWFNTTPCHAEWVINKAVQYANEVCKL